MASMRSKSQRLSVVYAKQGINHLIRPEMQVLKLRHLVQEIHLLQRLRIFKISITHPKEV